MKNKWFKEFGFLYYPVSWQGVLITLILLAFCINIFIFVDSQSHSASDTLYGIFPYIIPAFLLFVWIGAKKSKQIN